MSTVRDSSAIQVSGGDQPWLRNRRWRSGRIRDKSGSHIFFSVLFAVLINTVAILATISAWRDHAAGAGVLVFAFLLDGLGLLVLAWAIRQIRVRMKFGRSVFELETLPGTIGAWLAGTVRAPIILEATKGVRLELECTARRTVRTIDNKASMREETLWNAKQTLKGELPRDGSSTCIPVAFEIPADVSGSGWAGPDLVVWTLRVRAAQSGADYDAQFIVPVFEVPGARPQVPEAEGSAVRLRK